MEEADEAFLGCKMGTTRDATRDAGRHRMARLGQDGRKKKGRWFYGQEGTFPPREQTKEHVSSSRADEIGSQDPARDQHEIIETARWSIVLFSYYRERAQELQAILPVCLDNLSKLASCLRKKMKTRQGHVMHSQSSVQNM